VLVEDQHLRAGRLVFSRGRVAGTELAAAQGGISYGRVAVISLDQTIVSSVTSSLDTASALPLDAITKVIFPSADALDEFSARISGFGDVSIGDIHLVADGTLFVPGDPGPSDGNLPLEVIAAPEGADSGPDMTRDALAELDRQAGALAAVLAGAGWLNSDGLVGALEPVVDFEVSPERPRISIPEAVSGALDQGPTKPEAMRLLGALVKLVSAIPAGDALAPDAIIRGLGSTLETDGGSPPEVLEKFLRFAAEIIDAKRDLPERAFSDDEGSVTLRGILLFLLNPAADRLAAIRVRTSHLGPRVFCIAAALAGFHQGFSSLDVQVKGSGKRASAVPRMVLEAHRQLGPKAALSICWDRRSGERTRSLVWSGVDLVVAKSPVSSLFGELAQSLVMAGWRAEFEPASGVLQVGKPGHVGASTVAVFSVGACPTFPRSPGVVVHQNLDAGRARKQATTIVAAVNERASETGIFAIAVPAGKAVIVRFAAYVVAPVSVAAIEQVAEALQSAETSASSAAACSVAPQPGDDASNGVV
jgi:hypothetical protein